jgi:hypothetical protein
MKILAKIEGTRFMTLLLLEALGALVLLLLIVWWTMFSGRRGGELPPQEARGSSKSPDKPGAPPDEPQG